MLPHGAARMSLHRLPSSTDMASVSLFKSLPCLLLFLFPHIPRNHGNSKLLCCNRWLTTPIPTVAGFGVDRAVPYEVFIEELPLVVALTSISAC